MNNELNQTTQTTNEITESVEETNGTQNPQNLQNPQNTTPKPPKKKKKIGGWITLGIGAVAAVVVGLNFKSIEASVRKLVMSPEAYYCYVEEQAMESSSETVMMFYERFLEKYDTTQDSEFQNTFQVTFGDGLKDLMREVDADGLDKLDSIGLNILSAQYDNALKQSVTAQLLLNESAMLSGELLLDYKDDTAFIGLPEISNQYLYADMEEMFGIDAEDMKELTELLPKLYEQLPDKKAAYTLLERYVMLLLENVEDVEEEKTTLKVEGVSQACTEFSFYLDVEQIRELAVKVLEEIVEDKELEDYITGILSELEEIEELEIDADDVYDSFIDGLEDSIDEIKDLIDEGEEEGLEGLEVTVWVDKKGTVIGRKYEMEDAFLFYYGVATNGNDYGFETEISFDDEILVIKGEGSIDKDNVTGTFDFDLIEERIATVTVEELSLKKWKDGVFDGTVILTPDGATEDLIELWNEEDIYEIKNPQITISMSSEEKESILNITVENDEELFAELSYTHKQEKAEEQDFPKKEDAIKAENEEDYVRWVAAMDADALEEKMKEQDIPDVAAEGVSDYIRDLKYERALLQFFEKNYAVAAELFASIEDYLNSKDMKLCCDAMLLYEEGKYDEALEVFETIEESISYVDYYKDECLSKKAEQLLEEEKYKEAIAIYEDLRYSFDSGYLLEYAWGKYYMNEGDYAEAEYHLGLVDESVKDVSEDLKECSYQLGIAAMENGDYGEAYGRFMQIQGYKDADALAVQADAEVAILQAPVGTVFAPNYEDYVEGVTLPEEYLGIEIEKVTDRDFQEYLAVYVTQKMKYAMGMDGDVVYEPEMSFSDEAAKFMSDGKYPTEESLKLHLWDKCEEEKYAPQLRDYLLAHSSVTSIDEEYVKKQVSRVMFELEVEAAQYDMDVETFVTLIDYQKYQTLEEYRAEVEKIVRENETVFLAAYGIAKKEGFVLEEEEFMAYAEDFAEDYEITTEHFLQINDRSVLEQVFLIECAMDFMIENANFK